VLDAVVHGGDGPERVRAWQRPDGTVNVVAATSEGVDRVRFVLALDDDHSEFLRRFRKDRLLREATWHVRGLRIVRTPTVSLALLRALCGQLIESKRARELERRIVRAAMPRVGDLWAPPTAPAFVHFSPAELRRLGLHARRAAALVRVCSTLDLERLHTVSTEVAAARLQRERGLGPWSVGVICLEGLGRNEVGLVGDLGLIKLCSALRGRWVDAAETAELLEPYGEWAGLASVYLLAAFARGLVPLPDGSRVRKPPARIHMRAA
jgi:AraC family transcriptional regulator of adaptative response / DNA-3-methyladenine glycosylase II